MQNLNEKTPVPFGGKHGGTRAVTGNESNRSELDNTNTTIIATRPRITGTLHIQVSK